MEFDLKKEAEKTTVSPDQIADWRKKFPSGVFELIAGDKKGYIRKPDRNEMKMISSKGKMADPITLTEIILETLWLGGDDEIKTDDDLFYSVMETVQQVVEIKESQLKKL